MINKTYKQKLFIFRTILDIMLKTYQENDLIFVFFSKILNEPVYLTLNLDKRFLNYNELSIYKVTIKNFYLYCLKEEYVNVNWDILVLLANKSIKGYSSEQMAHLIGIPIDKYNHLEMGYYTFVNELSYDNISEKLEFSKDEFYFTFKDTFYYIEGGHH